jgi:hypothetical protein
MRETAGWDVRGELASVPSCSADDEADVTKYVNSITYYGRWGEKHGSEMHDGCIFHDDEYASVTRAFVHCIIVEFMTGIRLA